MAYFLDINFLAIKEEQILHSICVLDDLSNIVVRIAQHEFPFNHVRNNSLELFSSMPNLYTNRAKWLLGEYLWVGQAISQLNFEEFDFVLALKTRSA